MSLSIRQWLLERQIPLESLQTLGAEVSGVAFRLTQEMEIKSLTPFDICSLADVLEIPLTGSRLVARPLAQLTIALLRLLARKKPLKRSEGTWLAFQVAYLEALQDLLEQELRLGRTWLDRATIHNGSPPNTPLSYPQLQSSLKTLRPGKLTDSQAEQALLHLQESSFGNQITSVCVAWLMANGAEEIEASFLAQRLTNGLPGYLLNVVAESALPLAQLQKFVRLGHLSGGSNTQTGVDLEETALSNETQELTLNLEREYYRAHTLKVLGDPLLGELFSLKDIYVYPQAMVVNEGSGSGLEWETNSRQMVGIHTWAREQLEERESITIIEGESGSGKTCFCQMLAAQVAQELYPQWMPVFIRLRDVSLSTTLEKTLESAFPWGRFSDADGWLSANSPPCLLILDGLDELARSPQNLRHIRAFMDRVVEFHARRLSQNQTLTHKILITSRPNTIESVIRRYRVGSIFPLQAELQRAIIQPLSQDSLRQWFKSWSKLQSKQISFRYFSFLKEEGLFSRKTSVRDNADLVYQPLTLYLLGLLHRDGLLDKSLFRLKPTQARYEIYDRILRWLLGESTSGSLYPADALKEGMAHSSRSQEAIAKLLSGYTPSAYRALIQELALKVLHTGTWSLQTELKNQSLPALFFEQNSLNFKPTHQGTLGESLPITFSHPRLGYHLAAVEIAQQLKRLAQKVPDRYGDANFAIDSAREAAQHLYNLLGFGIISPEIEEMTIEHLQREEKRNPESFSFTLLFPRLEKFYRAYCQGRWLDEGLASQAHQHFQSLQNSFNTLQVDAAVGLNVFLLCGSISRCANLPFYPCGAPDRPQDFDPDRLLTLISRSTVLSPNCFWERARQSLSHLQLAGAYLSRAMLPEANLEQTNLSIAELSQANLASAYLGKANLSWALLVGANLSGSTLFQANLEGADLSGANLLGANLSLANLQNACLFQAQLDPDNDRLARQNGAIFSREEFLAYSKSLVPQIHLSDFADADFLDSESGIQIEIAEGEPFYVNAWDSGGTVRRREPAPNPYSTSPILSSDDDTLIAPEELGESPSQRGQVSSKNPQTIDEDGETLIAQPEDYNLDEDYFDDSDDSSDDDQTILLS